MGAVESKPLEKLEFESSVQQSIPEQPVVIVPIKVIFLGNRRSGCSTLMRQIEFLGGREEPSVEERQCMSDSIRLNMILMMRTLIRATSSLGVGHIEDCVLTSTDDVQSLVKDWTNTSAVLQKHWTNPLIQQTLSRSAEFNMKENSGYFFENLERISKYNYEPTTSDILHNSVRSMSVNEKLMQMEGRWYKLIDMDASSGKFETYLLKRSTRVDGDVVPIFVCSLSDFVVKSDNGVTVLRENLDLFAEFCKLDWAEKHEVIVVLTKIDIFRDYISDGYNIKSSFNEFTGSGEAQSLQFIHSKFKECKTGKPVHIFEVNVLDADNVKPIYDKVVSIEFHNEEINEV